MTTRQEPEKRHKQLLHAALDVAERDGFDKVTKSNVANEAGCTPNLINYYYLTSEELRNATMRAAVRRESLRVIAQGLAYEHPVALEAPRELQRKAVNALVR